MPSRVGWLPAAAFILIWSSGYLAAKAAAPHADPLTYLSWRYAGVVLLMGLLALAFRAPWPSRRDALLLALTGLGIQALYLGGVWVAVRQGMAASVVALIVNLQPVLIALASPWLGERLAPRQWLGVLLGFAGVALVVGHKLGGAELAPLPVLLAVLALLGITVGTLVQKRFVPHFDLRSGQVIQFSAALLLTLPLAAWLEPMRVDWNAATLGTMAWSIVVLTGCGISLMFWMLRHGQAAAVTSTMYLVPSVTALLAWSMFGETLGATAIVGMGVSLLGVYLVVAKPS
ncbi:DMT family transporter [Inhella sp.]|uniref:DMT family transporter n=1 Tax=Inhella sp. TaxID=1921806 RepID=UPI0035B3FF2A